MYTIHVGTGRPYDVLIGTRLLERAGELTREACGGTRAVVVTDTNVGPLYAHIVRDSLAGAGYDASVFTFEAGEESKGPRTYIDILEFMASRELTRKDVVVALGGGVAGDLAGFAAATYMRGCRLVQMPTSLLAMVDSSVGGKTAIDLAQGKNLAGSFWQPWIVIADIGCLGTLPAERIADGCGEIIKHGVIKDPELFGVLEERPLTRELVMEDLSLTAAIVARNVQVKRDVVTRDERESGERKLLNFGHSIGHAIEAESGFALGHGTCVAMGMVAMARAQARRGACPGELAGRIEALCAAHGLRTRAACSPEAAFREALHDKKRSGDSIDIVVPHAIGDCTIETVSLDDFRAILTDGLAGEGGASC